MIRSTSKLLKRQFFSLKTQYFANISDNNIETLLSKYPESTNLDRTDFFSLLAYMNSAEEETSILRADAKILPYILETYKKPGLEPVEYLVYQLKKSQIESTEQDKEFLQDLLSKCPSLPSSDEILAQLLEILRNYKSKPVFPASETAKLEEYVKQRLEIEFPLAKADKIFNILRILIFMEDSFTESTIPLLRARFDTVIAKNEFSPDETIKAFHLMPKYLAEEQKQPYKDKMVSLVNKHSSNDVFLLTLINYSLFNDDFTDMFNKIASFINTNLMSLNNEIHLEVFFLALRAKQDESTNFKELNDMVKNTAICLRNPNFQFDATGMGGSKEINWLKERVENFRFAYGEYKKDNEDRENPEFNAASVILEKVIEECTPRYVPSERNFSGKRIGEYLVNLQNILSKV